MKNPNYTERTYFEVNRFNRSVPLNENETYYQGYSIGVSNSWRPYGKGEFTLDEKPLLKGSFNKKGLVQGYGEFVFYRDEKPWKTFKGQFMDGNMAGAGVLVDVNANEEEVIAKDNEVICTRADLDVGTQLELNDFSLHVHADSQRCIVLKHVKNWVYRVRFHEDVRPLERDVDLAGLKRFRVLRHLPKVRAWPAWNRPTPPPGAPNPLSPPPSSLPLQICHLSQMGMPMAATSSYDYWKDTFGVTDGRPRLGHAGGRKTPEMRIKDLPPLKPAERARSDRQESFFESSAVNIGAAIDDQASRVKREARKQQWEAMVARRREEQERDRAALIEKERKKGASLAVAGRHQTPPPH